MVIKKTKHWVYLLNIFIVIMIVFWVFATGTSGLNIAMMWILVIAGLIAFYKSHYLELKDDEIIVQTFPFRTSVIKIKDIMSVESSSEISGGFEPIMKYIIITKDKRILINRKHYVDKDFKLFVKTLYEKIDKNFN